MTSSRRKRILSVLMLLVIAVAIAAYIKRDSITWRLKMYTRTDITSWSAPLERSMKESSGLLWWNGLLWTMMDQGPPRLYALDPATGKTVKWVTISNASNDDWEDLAQDDKYFYIGDIGDNSLTARYRPSTIYRVSKKAMTQMQDSVMADTLQFELEDWVNDRHRQENNTDFDCEAMIAFGDSLYLFSKQWHSEKTTVYVLPKKPGKAIARKKQVYNIGALITGATYYKERNLVALTGYHTDMRSYLTPFVYLLTDFEDDDFFSGRKKKIYLGKPLHQVEAVCTPDGQNFYFTNEGLTWKGIGVDASLMKADLGKYY